MRLFNYCQLTGHYSTELDNILLSVFAHRFMSIAEQMGRTLQRTSISTNIKERLDFSCALFGVSIDWLRYGAQAY
jgi:N-methylhydantoinase B/oxoprolinase/acetone carboxylase alpha subunit